MPEAAESEVHGIQARLQAPDKMAVAPGGKRVRRLAGPGMALALMALISGCSPGSTSAPVDIPEGPCPPPSMGIAMGGVGGVGDAVATPVPRLVLMGGGAENDEASNLFLDAAQGGDVIVLRASGSVYTYINYFHFHLLPAVKPSSVNTILTTVPQLGGDESVLCRLRYAEAIWLAGGDQWDYLGGWPAGLHDALADFISDGGAMGGTSAGAVSLGEAAFDARNGTVTSEMALHYPTSSSVSISYPSFAHPRLESTLVDSHFSQRSREGRILAFLARFLVEKEKSQVLGIGLDEGVAMVLDGGGFRVFGPQDGAAWVYSVTGPALLSEDLPLDLEGILRVRLAPGAQGDWPLDFQEFSGVELRVSGGVLGPA